MFDSPESASLWFDIFNGVLFFGALLVTIGTWGTIKTAGIKERFSDERIASNEAETKRAIADSDSAKEGTAKANERIAELTTQGDIARKETAQAKLELQQIRFPRRLDSDKLRAGIGGMPSQFFEVLYDQSAADGSGLAFEIFVTLASIGWKTDQKLPAPLTPQLGPPNLRDVYQLLPLTEQAGASAWGVSVVTKGPISDDPKMPERILGNALLISVASPIQMVGGGKDETMPAGKIRIIVGPKLP